MTTGNFFRKLKSRTEQQLTKAEAELLPRSYQIIGKILVLKLKKELYEKRKFIAEKILEILPCVRTVCLLKEISGEERKPEIEIIAGENNTCTIHKEHGCRFLIDVSESMFSKGNKFEKTRLLNAIKKDKGNPDSFPISTCSSSTLQQNNVDETIVDMFAGIGYWSIILAKLSPAKKIYSIDINPKAVEYLKKNIELNKINNIEVFEGDCRDFPKENIADRIIMGYLYETEKFLPSALKMAKPSCIIHLHRNLSEAEIEGFKEKLIEIGKENNCSIEVLEVKKIKSYAPKVWHFVFDLLIKKL